MSKYVLEKQDKGKKTKILIKTKQLNHYYNTEALLPVRKSVANSVAFYNALKTAFPMISYESICVMDYSTRILFFNLYYQIITVVLLLFPP